MATFLQNSDVGCPPSRSSCFRVHSYALHSPKHKIRRAMTGNELNSLCEEASTMPHPHPPGYSKTQSRPGAGRITTQLCQRDTKRPTLYCFDICEVDAKGTKTPPRILLGQSSTVCESCRKLGCCEHSMQALEETISLLAVDSVVYRTDTVIGP